MRPSGVTTVPDVAVQPLGDGCAEPLPGLSEGERYDEWRRLRSGEAVAVARPDAILERS